jgi:hypothetical protein
MFRKKLSVNNQETAESKGFAVEIGNSRHIISFWYKNQFVSNSEFDCSC